MESCYDNTDVEKNYRSPIEQDKRRVGVLIIAEFDEVHTVPSSTIKVCDVHI